MNQLARILKDPRTEHVVLGLIIFNAITLGLETSATMVDQYGDLLYALDRAVLTVFVVELVARMGVFRAAFFRDPWSCSTCSWSASRWCAPRHDPSRLGRCRARVRPPLKGEISAAQASRRKCLESLSSWPW